MFIVIIDLVEVTLTLGLPLHKHFHKFEVIKTLAASIIAQNVFVQLILARNRNSVILTLYHPHINSTMTHFSFQLNYVKLVETN